jgi:apolipoprotein N-acyltransferase
MAHHVVEIFINSILCRPAGQAEYLQISRSFGSSRDTPSERIAVMICYEDVFGAEQLHYLPDATLLVNVSNDAWFGDSFAAHQHLQIARVRAAVVGRYMLRTTNTGVTAVIGQLLGRVGRGRRARRGRRTATSGDHAGRTRAAGR